MSKKFINNPLFIGGTVFQLVNAATSALYANWITNYSKDGYNLTLVISSVIGIIVSLSFSINSINKLIYKMFHFDVRSTYNKFVKFLLVEGFANLVSIIITSISRAPLGAIIIAIILTPLSKLQAYSVNEIASKMFKTAAERKEYDDFLTSISPFVNAVGFAIGFAVNHLCDGYSAYILLCIAEIINNVFYFKAYRNVESVEDIEDEVDEEDVDAEEDATTEA